MLRLILSVFLVAFIQVANADENHCKDQETNHEWFEMIATEPQDQDLISLVALRLGLCAMVDLEMISVDDATTIFESERMDLIEERNPGWGMEHNDSEA